MYYSVFFNSSTQAPINKRAYTFAMARRMKEEGERDGYVVRVFDFYGNEVKF